MLIGQYCCFTAVKAALRAVRPAVDVKLRVVVAGNDDFVPSPRRTMLFFTIDEPDPDRRGKMIIAAMISTSTGTATIRIFFSGKDFILSMKPVALPGESLADGT